MISIERGPNGTAYVWTEVPIGGGLVFYVDGNSKITASNGTYADPVPNAFSLPHQSTCPGATPSCLASCYVHGLEKHAPATYARYRQNEQALHRVLMTAQGADYAASALGDWIAEHAPGGFRWHVSGDIMHSRHAAWIARACVWSHRVTHWIYTKSFACVPPLLAAPNLTINLSADRDNYGDAAALASDCYEDTGRTLRICYMSQAPEDVPADLPPGSVIFPDYPARGRELDDPTSHAWWQARTHAERAMTCGADFFGQSEAHRCGPCRKCIDRVSP
jgi:hypothetical protein